MLLGAGSTPTWEVALAASTLLRSVSDMIVEATCS